MGVLAKIQDELYNEIIMKDIREGRRMIKQLEAKVTSPWSMSINRTESERR